MAYANPSPCAIDLIFLSAQEHLSIFSNSKFCLSVEPFPSATICCCHYLFQLTTQLSLDSIYFSRRLFSFSLHFHIKIPWNTCWYLLSPSSFLLFCTYFSKFFYLPFYYKNTTDLCVVKSNDQYSAFLSLDPWVAFDKANHFPLLYTFSSLGFKNTLSWSSP